MTDADWNWMEKLKDGIAALPAITMDGEAYLSYRAVTDMVAAFLYPAGASTHPTDRLEEAEYRRILDTADALCRELGYVDVVKLVPPDVRFSDMGLYWAPAFQPAPEPEPVVIHAGPGRIEMMQEGLLLDAGHLLDARRLLDAGHLMDAQHPAGASLTQLGLDEVSRQHFKIPVTASDGLIDLLHRAAQSGWPYDYRGLWHDVCTMCVAGGQDVSPIERRFAVIIRGLDRQRTWQMRALLKQDYAGAPYLRIALAEERDKEQLFELGHVVMTPGAAALNVDFAPYLARHLSGDWGSLTAFDIQQNNQAVRDGLRILSAYDVPVADGETERIWIITEADRSATSVILPEEY